MPESRYIYDRNGGGPGKVYKSVGTWSGELDDLLKLEGGLTAWELTFVESVADQRRWKGWLTAKQVKVIARIWDREVGSKPCQ